MNRVQNHPDASSKVPPPFWPSRKKNLLFPLATGLAGNPSQVLLCWSGLPVHGSGGGWLTAEEGALVPLYGQVARRSKEQTSNQKSGGKGRQCPCGKTYQEPNIQLPVWSWSFLLKLRPCSAAAGADQWEPGGKMWFNFPCNFHLTEKEHLVGSELWTDFVAGGDHMLAGTAVASLNRSPS